MPETVTFDEDLGIVRIESYGDLTAEDLRATLGSALKMHQVRGVSRGFVDATRVTSYPSTFPIFDFGSQAATRLRGLRIAIATTPGMLDTPVFFETAEIGDVPRNYGLQNWIYLIHAARR